MRNGQKAKLMFLGIMDRNNKMKLDYEKSNEDSNRHWTHTLNPNTTEQ